MTAATVTVPMATWSTVAEDVRHSTVVPLDHADVAQSTEAKVAVGVRSVEAKAMPLSVAVRPPEEGALFTPTKAQLRAGAAKSTKDKPLKREYCPSIRTIEGNYRNHTC